MIFNMSETNSGGGGTTHTVTSYDGADIFYSGIYHADGDYVEMALTNSLTLSVGAVFVMINSIENVSCYSADYEQEYEIWALPGDLSLGVMPDTDIVIEYE